MGLSQGPESVVMMTSGAGSGTTWDTWPLGYLRPGETVALNVVNGYFGIDYV